MDKMDFWIQLGVSYVWAAPIVTGIAMFGVGMGIMRLIDNRRKEFAEDRLKRVSERVVKQDKSAQALFKRVAKLDKAVTEEQPLRSIKRVVKDLVTDSGALADSTRVTSDLLTRYWTKKR
jgi:uncharacterized membrane-anchored protein YhcB (DUF1043 family)